jgi:hypothetical protein
MHSKHSAIALMITLFFIIAISISLAISLKQAKSVRTEVSKQQFAMQSSMIVHDVKAMLDKMSGKMNTPKNLFTFLNQNSNLIFEINGMMVHIEIKSARAKVNLNILKKNNADIKYFKNHLSRYFDLYGISSTYLDMIIDNVSGIKADDSYNSNIFTQNPYLFRDYIASYAHLNKINDFYTKMYNDNALSKIDFEELFYFSKDVFTKLDVNYANVKAWRFLLGCDKARAEDLVSGAGNYEKKADLGLDPLESKVFDNLNIYSFFEKFLDIKISLDSGTSSSTIRFEYDLEKKKGSNFVYEL